MDMNLFRGVMTAVWMLIFIAVVWWAYSPRRKAGYEKAARLALEDELPTQDDDKNRGV